MNNYLNVKKEFIYNNFFENQNFENLYMVTKANFYGFGPKIITIANKFVQGYVFNHFSHYLAVKNNVVNKKNILLYPDLNKETLNELIINKNLFCVVMNDEQEKIIIEHGLLNKAYIRIDPFLGNHGFSINYLNRKHIKNYYGIFLHVNESLTEKEFKVVENIESICESEKVRFNIGGSCVLKENRLKSCTEIRAMMNFLLPRTPKTSFDERGITLKTKTLCSKVIKNSYEVGYKSNRTTVGKGTLITISIGYDEFHLLKNLYKQNMKFEILGREFYIPCEPCMNTCWLYSNDFVLSIPTDLTLLNTGDFYRISSLLDVDIDEIFTSFKSLEVKII